MKKAAIIFTLLFSLSAVKVFGQENQARKLFEEGWVGYRSAKTIYEMEVIYLATVKVNDPHKDWYTLEEAKSLFKKRRWDKKDYIITIKQMTRYLKYDAVGLEDKMNILFDLPPQEQGNRFIVLRSPVKSDEVHAYYPALRRRRRLPAADQQDTFAESTLTHEENRRLMGELGKMANKFSFSLAKEEVAIDGKLCYVIEVRPDPAKKPDTGYSLRKFYREEKSLIFVRVEYFDKYGNHVKTQKNSDIYLNELGLWRPRLLEVYKEKDRKSTILYWTERKILDEKDVPPRIFAPIYLEEHGG